MIEDDLVIVDLMSIWSCRGLPIRQYIVVRTRVVLHCPTSSTDINNGGLVGGVML